MYYNNYNRNKAVFLAYYIEAATNRNIYAHVIKRAANLHELLSQRRHQTLLKGGGGVLATYMYKVYM